MTNTINTNDFFSVQLSNPRGLCRIEPCLYQHQISCSATEGWFTLTLPPSTNEIQVHANATMEEFKTLLQDMVPHVQQVELHVPNSAEFTTSVGVANATGAGFTMCKSSAVYQYELTSAGIVDTDTLTSTNVQNTIIITYTQLDDSALPSPPGCPLVDGT